MYVCVCMYVSPSLSLSLYIYICVYVYTHTYIYTYTYTYTCTHTHIHLHIHLWLNEGRKQDAAEIDCLVRAALRATDGSIASRQTGSWRRAYLMLSSNVAPTRCR